MNSSRVILLSALLTLYLLSLALDKYREMLKEQFRSLGVITLGKLNDSVIPIKEIKSHIKLVNTSS